MFYIWDTHFSNLSVQSVLETYIYYNFQKEKREKIIVLLRMC